MLNFNAVFILLVRIAIALLTYAILAFGVYHLFIPGSVPDQMYLVLLVLFAYDIRNTLVDKIKK